MSYITRLACHIQLALGVAVAACSGCATKAPPSLPPQGSVNGQAPSASRPPAPPSPGDALADAGPAPGRVRLALGTLSARPIPLPGASGPAFLDYIAYEPARARVWVPVAATGSVDVLDIAGGAFTRVDGFKSDVRDSRGQKRTVGPSAVSVGEGFAYVGNRATGEVCPVDLGTLKVAPCTTLASASDGVAYVAPVKEVWVTTPRAQALVVLDASSPAALKVKATIKVEGEPEGYAVDAGGGVFFTNLEDKGRTLVIDVKTHHVRATYDPGCGADGPRGLAFDAVHGFVVVACTDHVQVLDAGHDGARLGALDTGAGLDNIDLVNGRVYAAAGKAARLTVAEIDDKGQLAVVGRGDTSEGARNAVADARGNAYVADSLGARLLVLAPAQ